MVVSLRATTGATPVPTGPDLATATLPGFNDGGAGGLKSVTFASPPTVTAGMRYALVFRLASAFASGTVAYTCSCATTGFSNSSPYANGQRVTSTNSGSAWTADTTTGGRDLNFRTYVDPGFAASATYVSSIKDANPAPGATPTWTTLSFTDTTPSGTNVRLQVAGSNSVYGPFTFVGPDGTSSTFFASGADLSQFDGSRYLRYKATLTTSNSSVTPALSSVSVCFADTAATGVATIRVTVPTKVTAGRSFTVSADALDSLGAVVTGYSDPAAAVTDTAGELPAGTTIAFVNGHAQTQLTLPSALHADSLSITSGSATGSSASFAVLGPLAQITVGKIATGTVGSSYTVKATALDSAGNVLTAYAGSATVTDLVGGNASASFIKGKLTAAVTPSGPSKADVATVTSSGISGQSAGFKVLGPLATIKVTTTGPYSAGAPFSVTALALDAAGNTLTGYAGAATASDLTGASATPTFTAGKATFQLTPTGAKTGDRVTVTTGAATGKSKVFNVS